MFQASGDLAEASLDLEQHFPDVYGGLYRDGPASVCVLAVDDATAIETAARARLGPSFSVGSAMVAWPLSMARELQKRLESDRTELLSRGISFDGTGIRVQQGGAVVVVVGLTPTDKARLEMDSRYGADHIAIVEGTVIAEPGHVPGQ